MATATVCTSGHQGRREKLAAALRARRSRALHGLGPLHTITLDEARERAGWHVSNCSTASTPSTPARPAGGSRLAGAKALSFAAAAQTYFDQNSMSWRNAKHRRSSSARCRRTPSRSSALAGQRDRRARMCSRCWSRRSRRSAAIRLACSGTCDGKRRAGSASASRRVLDWARCAAIARGDNPARWQGYLQHALPKNGQVAQSSIIRRCPIAICLRSWPSCASAKASPRRRWRFTS